MARNFTIYDSRNRMTGTRCVTLDLRHADATKAVVDAAKGKRYAAMCVDHNEVIFFDEHYPAGRAIAHVDEWCKKCQAMLAKGEKIGKPAKVEAPVPTPIASAPSGKRTSSKATNVATQRKAAQAKAPGPVEVKTPARKAGRPKKEVAVA